LYLFAYKDKLGERETWNGPNSKDWLFRLAFLLFQALTGSMFRKNGGTMDDNRTDMLHFKTSAPERMAAEAIARREHVKLSEALRMALREAATRRGLWPPMDVLENPVNAAKIA
jgi:hypothetical protein